MLRNIVKSAIVLLFITPLFSIADTQIDWQKIDQDSAESFNIGQGAFLSKHKDHLLVSAGLNTQLSATNAQAKRMQIITDDSTITTNLTAELGNRAFAAATAFHHTTIVAGGIANNTPSALVNVLSWQASTQTLHSYSLPALPKATQSPATVIINNKLYVLTGSDTNHQFYSLDLSPLLNAEGILSLNDGNSERFTATNSWQTLAALPLAGNSESLQSAVHLAVQNDGNGAKVFAIGSYQDELLVPSRHISSHWQYDPATDSTNAWLQLGAITIDSTELNEKINSVSTYGHSHILAFTNQGNTLSFNAITKSWTQYLATTLNSEATATQPISERISAFDGDIYSLTSIADNQGSLQLWQASLKQPKKDFGWINMTVLVVYLLCVVLVGLFFVFKNNNTDDYFRGGQSIPWWAAACSIYATMLSSLTYVALPAIVYQTNWLLLIGIWMIVAVAPIAIYVAMPFFRQIDATSAYEYLSKRFNMSVRLFASGLFTLFHIGRMGIVMALTALALSAVTPLSASDSVLIMGVLCLIYCTMGGIEAVIWTDTLQTIVLLVGAVVCFVTIILGLDGGISEFITIGFNDNKFTMANTDFSLNSITTLSIWVIVLGGIGQNISSYTADQAVVQRYMVTSDPQAAAKSIWANVGMALPGTFLFFCIGTGLYAFYQMNPGKLDPTIQIDQIFPTFIATELPVGIAGLIVAGIFAAAQSTVSTSMNSIATTLVTDFIRPFNVVKTEKGYMSAARWLTFIMGALGTLAGLIFIDPEIRSLMNAYFKVIGMFMGALGGLFVLGALTKRANSTGAIIGILTGVATMISAWQMGWANGYLYATIGIMSCLIVGYVASVLFPGSKHAAAKNLAGLTLYTMQPTAPKLAQKNKLRTNLDTIRKIL